MPEEFEKKARETLAEVRALLADLQALGVGEVPAAFSCRDLPLCPPGVVGCDHGGDAACQSESATLIRDELGDCRRCSLAAGRERLVFGTGPQRPLLLFVVPPPGREDDGSGVPLVSGAAAGDLFDRMLAAMRFERSDVGIVPIVCCHPPSNRPVSAVELAACAPFVRRQILAAAPQIVVVCGSTAAAGLFGADAVAAGERGLWQEWEGLPVLVTHDPAWLLHHPAAKRDAWDDLKKVLRRLEQR